MPDIFVPQDTTGFNACYMSLSRSGLFRSYTFNYTDVHRTELSKYNTMESLYEYVSKAGLFSNFIAEARRKGIVNPSAVELDEARKNITTVLYGNVIYNMLGMEEYLRFLNQSDPVVLKAVDILEKEESVPAFPSED